MPAHCHADDNASPDDEYSFAEPCEVGGRALVNGTLSDLPHIGVASLVGYQEQASGTIPVLVDRRHGGEFGELLTEVGRAV